MAGPEATQEQAAPQTVAMPGEVQVEQKNIGDLDWDMPSDEKLAEFKKEFGERIRKFVFRGPVPGTAEVDEFGKVLKPGKDFTFLLRVMGRKEYKSIIYDINLNIEDREDAICQTLCLWPEGIDFALHFGEGSEKAGIPSMLSEFVMEASGFVPPIEMGKV